ncbi:MAG: NAD(P)/FAD-dependent oxidoreductase [Candidatus Woesearchaeota archaeon]
MRNTVIVGAGPAGSYLGWQLSKRGIQNTIVEEHEEIGRPEQCTGIISRNIEDPLPPPLLKKAVQNKVKGAVISCGKQQFEIRKSSFMAYIFDRQKLDRVIAEKAVKAGSDLLLGRRYVSHRAAGKSLKIRLAHGSETKHEHAGRLVGADGPHSIVARNAGLYGRRRFWTGTQVLLRTRKPFFDKDMAYLWLDRKYSDGFFAWVVPVDDHRAKAGLASFSKPAKYLERFLKDMFDDFVVEEKQGGIIPVYQKIPLQTKDRKVSLVGDAALQVKATSGGGVVNGLLAAEKLAGVIAEGGDYERRLGGLRRSLWLHSIIRNKLNIMGDERKEKLLEELNSGSVKKVLKEKGDMDFPGRFLFRLLMARPGLLRYVL